VGVTYLGTSVEEDSHANLHHPFELHGSGSSQREKLSQAGRSIQGDGEEARSDREGDIYWTQGRYDVVTITEAPDDMAATALSLSIAGLGNVRTETLRAFSAADMQTIIGKMA
jgi:GYD domain